MEILTLPWIKQCKISLNKKTVMSENEIGKALCFIPLFCRKCTILLAPSIHQSGLIPALRKF